MEQEDTDGETSHPGRHCDLSKIFHEDNWEQNPELDLQKTRPAPLCRTWIQFSEKRESEARVLIPALLCDPTRGPVPALGGRPWAPKYWKSGENSVLKTRILKTENLERCSAPGLYHHWTGTAGTRGADFPAPAPLSLCWPLSLQAHLIPWNTLACLWLYQEAFLPRKFRCAPSGEATVPQGVLSDLPTKKGRLQGNRGTTVLGIESDHFPRTYSGLFKQSSLQSCEVLAPNGV